jgi:hypothetical protein
VQIGPGYDDSPVPDRTTPTRDRLAGGYYAASWLLALQARPQLIILETWSELHEGTDICETSEDGRYYIELTRRYSDLLRAGRDPLPEDWAASVRLLLSGQKSNPAGREFASHVTLNLHVASDGKVVEQGGGSAPPRTGSTRSRSWATRRASARGRAWERGATCTSTWPTPATSTTAGR